MSKPGPFGGSLIAAISARRGIGLCGQTGTPEERAAHLRKMQEDYDRALAASKAKGGFYL